MSLGITKECFPPARKCHNCERKSREDILENPDGRKDFKRCTGCHLLTYCDKDCQREHWQKVHKRHCGFLSGQKQVKNSQHRRQNCSMCIEERNSRATELISATSSKSTCYIESIMILMKMILGDKFGFHKEGKKCNCCLKFACELPFALGEISGDFVGNGLDEFVAHSLKIVNALLLKGANKHDTFAQLRNLRYYLVEFKADLWKKILIRGIPRFEDDTAVAKYLSEPVSSLRNVYGPNDPWWKALYYSIGLITHFNTALISEVSVNGNLDEQKFGIFKKIREYLHSQIINQDVVTKQKMWPIFKLWPVHDNGELVLLLPEGARCQNCETPLSGQFSVIGNVSTSTNVYPPIILPKIGDNGELVLSCLKQRCREKVLNKDLMHTYGMDEPKWRKYVEEQRTYSIVSRVCDFCLKESLSSHRCSGCKAAQYCSSQCQLEDVSFHKTVCSIWATDKLRKIGDAKYQKKTSKSKAEKQVETSDKVLKEFYDNLEDRNRF